jgi:hypothetical protein
MANISPIRTLLLFAIHLVTVDTDGVVRDAERPDVIVMEIEPEEFEIHGQTDESLKAFLEGELTYDYWDAVESHNRIVEF